MHEYLRAPFLRESRSCPHPPSPPQLSGLPLAPFPLEADAVFSGTVRGAEVVVRFSGVVVAKVVVTDGVAWTVVAPELVDDTPAEEVAEVAELGLDEVVDVVELPVEVVVEEVVEEVVVEEVVVEVVEPADDVDVLVLVAVVVLGMVVLIVEEVFEVVVVVDAGTVVLRTTVELTSAVVVKTAWQRRLKLPVPCGAVSTGHVETHTMPCRYCAFLQTMHTVVFSSAPVHS
jgi:hypothetical protein